MGTPKLLSLIQRLPWLALVFVAGLILGLLLVVNVLLAYRSAGRLVGDHLATEAGRHISSLEQRAREAAAVTSERLDGLLDELKSERAGEIAWIRIANQDGRITARTSGASDGPIARSTLDALLDLREHSVRETRARAEGDVLVVTLPFRFRPASERPDPGRELTSAARPGFMVAEAALILGGPADPFWPLRRALVVGLSAAVALIAAMVSGALLFPRFLRGKRLEHQLAVARRVQQELLPRDYAGGDGLDVAAVCLPAWQVGGDYYDVFPVRNGQVALALGDVAGKGLPAALIMSFLHGAVRTASGLTPETNHSQLVAGLNELLLVRTAEERFVTLFWAFVDQAQGTLRYVNAGHLPPILVRGGSGETAGVDRLDRGGPVLGLLPGARYDHAEVPFRAGDLLVLYSDGLAEATDAADTEFGEERLLGIVLKHRERPATEVLAAILDEVKRFVGAKPFQDDLTVLVVARPADDIQQPAPGLHVQGLNEIGNDLNEIGTEQSREPAP